MTTIAEKLLTLQHMDPCYPTPHPVCVEAKDALDAAEKALTLTLPQRVALNNPNVPDSTEIELTATLGDLRAVAAALAKLRGVK